MSDIFTKWHVEGFDTPMVLHEFTEPEPLEADSHSHPFDFVSHVISGGYIERVYTIYDDGKWTYNDIERKPGTVHKIKAETIHKIISLPNGKCITLMIPDVWKQRSGFYRFEENGVKFRYWDEENFREI